VVTDEPETLSYQIILFGPIGADVRQIALAAKALATPVTALLAMATSASKILQIFSTKILVDMDSLGLFSISC
jgi:hypothetical protein